MRPGYSCHVDVAVVAVVAEAWSSFASKSRGWQTRHVWQGSSNRRLKELLLGFLAAFRYCQADVFPSKPWKVAIPWHRQRRHYRYSFLVLKKEWEF